MNATRMPLRGSGTDCPKTPEEATRRPLNGPSLPVGLSDYNHSTSLRILFMRSLQESSRVRPEALLQINSRVVRNTFKFSDLIF